MSKPRTAIIGLGRMGYPMARHVAAAGFPLVVHDSRADVVVQFCAANMATPARSLADLGAAEIVITMLPTSREVAEVVTRPDGLAERLASAAILVDCSSSAPLETRRLGGLLRERGIGMVDAPVAGGVIFAEEGNLDVMVGGEPADVARATPVLSAFAKSVLPCGGLGSAHAMKALNNFINAQALITYAEAMTVGRRFGIDIATMVEALRAATTGRNHPFEKKIESQVLTGRYASGGSIGLIGKDVALAGDLAQALALWSPIVVQTAALWAQAAETLGAAADQTEIVRLWEERAGVTLRGRPAEGPS
ncbi:MAG: NAD(P)-dependent oxidoreductase [Hyphomonadaceae bacterium]|nr:NAD(P)-dependent oxidoreductase [Hyphomonadaceae bacterium]